MLFFLLLLSSLFFPKNILAVDLEQAKNDYLYQRSLYQIDHIDYLEKLQIHQKFYSITTKQDLFDTEKKVLISRNQNVRTYLIYLSSKLDQCHFRPETTKLLQQLSQQRQDWLFEQNKQIGNSQELSQLQPLSLEFSQKYPEILSLIYSALSQIQIDQQQFILQQITDLKQSVQTQNSQVDPQWFEDFDKQTSQINQHLQNAFLLLPPENTQALKFYKEVQKELQSSQSLLIKTKEDLKSVIVKFF
jgi:hypothetical protein